MEKEATETIGSVSSKTVIVLLIILTFMLWFIYKIDTIEYKKQALDKTLSRTVLKIKNSSTEDSVLTYLTLGSDSQFITNVHGIFGITNCGTQGSFYQA